MDEGQTEHDYSPLGGEGMVQQVDADPFLPSSSSTEDNNMQTHQVQQQQQQQEGTSTTSYTEFYARLGQQNEDELQVNSSQQQQTRTTRNNNNARQHRGSSTSSADSQQQHLGASLLRGGGQEELLPPVSTTRRLRVRENLFSMSIIAVAFLLTIVLLWWISGGSKSMDPPSFKPAPSYEVSFVLTLANGLEEPGIAMVDTVQNMMRVSYYSGMTTFILRPNSTSYSIVPRIDRLTCFEETGIDKLQSVFPDTKRFKFVAQKDLNIKPRGAKAAKQSSSSSDTTKKKNIRKITVEEWVYRTKTDKGEGGYSGTYTLWTLPGSNNVPVRFRFSGQNVILGETHFDSYTVDYYDYRDLSTNEGGVDPFWLKPPHGMPCVQSSNSMRSSSSIASNQVQKWNMLFPENEQERSEEYDVFHSRFSVKEKSPSRKMLFHQTLRLIEAHNRDETKSYKLGLNHFADWTAEERRSFIGSGLRRKRKPHSDLPKSECKIESLQTLLDEYKAVNLPGTIDHIENGLTLPPAEQGACGSSWAFSAAGVIEAQIAKKVQKAPVALSVQNMVDCSWMIPYKNLGCDGGLDYMAYMWAINHNEGRIATEDSYPFLNQDGFCHFDLKRELVYDGAHSQKGAPRVTQCFHVTEAFEGNGTFEGNDLVKAFNLRLNSVGPLSVSIDASPGDFFFYKSGVYDNHACRSDADSLDHTVLAVGAELTSTVPVTKIRNSFGDYWGEGGYARIAQKDNICGVATAATYVVVEL